MKVRKKDDATRRSERRGDHSLFSSIPSPSIYVVGFPCRTTSPRLSNVGLSDSDSHLLLLLPRSIQSLRNDERETKTKSARRFVSSLSPSPTPLSPLLLPSLSSPHHPSKLNPNPKRENANSPPPPSQSTANVPPPAISPSQPQQPSPSPPNSSPAWPSSLPVLQRRWSLPEPRRGKER